MIPIRKSLAGSLHVGRTALGVIGSGRSARSEVVYGHASRVSGLGQLAAREHARRALRIPDEAPVVTAVAELSAWSRHDDVLLAAHIVLETCASAVFVIAGPGKLRAALEKRARSLGIGGSFRLLAAGEEGPELLAASDVFVQASPRAGLSGSLVEAMSCGLPVIAADVGILGNVVVDSATGLLTPPRDPVALAGNILGLLLHADQRCRLGQAASRRIVRGCEAAQDHALGPER